MDYKIVILEQLLKFGLDSMTPEITSILPTLVDFFIKQINQINARRRSLIKRAPIQPLISFQKQTLRKDIIKCDLRESLNVLLTSWAQKGFLDCLSEDLKQKCQLMCLQYA